MLVQKMALSEKYHKFLYIFLFFTLWIANPLSGNTEDWPMWRYNYGRSANSPDELNEVLYLQWTRKLESPKSCWPSSEYRMQFDASYEPIVIGNTVYIPSMVRDCVMAFDTETGDEKWTFYAEGPVRFAPVAWKDKIYFISDDSFLYCLNAETGKLVWKFQGSPSNYKLLGNERLISMWPARGGPVIHEDIIYFAASIWPFMGTFIHAVNANNGAVVWTNSGSGSIFILQPHNSPAFAGVAPQGYLAISGDKLLVSGGRSVPACYDLHTGKLLYYQAVTKYGGYDVFSNNDFFFNDGHIYDIKDGKHLSSSPVSILTEESMIGIDPEGLIVARKLEPITVEYTDRRGRIQKRIQFPEIWRIESCLQHIFIKAGSQIYGGAKNLVGAINISMAKQGRKSTLSWSAPIEGEPWSMIAANGKLYVITREGCLFCFGPRKIIPKTLRRAIAKNEENDDSFSKMAEKIIEETGIKDGYCLILGLENGRLMEEFLRQSNLNLIGLDSNPQKIAFLRKYFDEKKVYGKRISLITGDLISTPLSPYLASLVVVENFPDSSDYSGMIQRVYQRLRPYGGTACFQLKDTQQSKFLTQAELLNLSNAVIRSSDNFVYLKRIGSLPGSAEWTHQYGDIANTVCSKDSRVKPPLGPLWFGGPSHLDVLPRHGHGPPPQIVDGRLFIEGINVFSARDVYTGRILWRKEFPNLNTFDQYYNDTYNHDPLYRGGNQEHYPGANAFGTNFVAVKDRIYLLCDTSCFILDPATGDTIDKFILPDDENGEKRNWGYIGVYEDLLIAGASPFHVFEHDKNTFIQPNNRYGMGSQYLIVLNRYTGNPLWERKAVFNYRHNAIVAGNDKIFCIDGITGKQADILKRRGHVIQGIPSIQAFDIRTGEEKWKVDENVFGTWLGYSEEFNVILQAGSRAGDRAFDEVDQGMSVLNASTGALIWKNNDNYSGPCILHHDKIITQTGGSNQTSLPAKIYHLLTGEIISASHPVTGDTIPQSWIRFKGCNTAIASEHLLTFRSAAAAYVDLTNQSGTTTIGGFRSGCTSNLIAADGVLNAPDYTRTCTCSYQNQTSLALIHMPEHMIHFPTVESWSFNSYLSPEEPRPVQRLGINFGASGNRIDDGMLWLEYPSVGGPSPDIPIRIDTGEPSAYRYHSSLLPFKQEESLNWIAASGITGMVKIIIRPFIQPIHSKNQVKIEAFTNSNHTSNFENRFNEIYGSHATFQPYKLVLHFYEPENLKRGDRVFDVLIQGIKRLENVDIIKEIGNTNHSLVKTIENVQVKDDLTILLKRSSANSKYDPLLSGLEIHFKPNG